jgi:hypothetical protein
VNDTRRKVGGLCNIDQTLEDVCVLLNWQGICLPFVHFGRFCKKSDANVFDSIGFR